MVFSRVVLLHRLPAALRGIAVLVLVALAALGVRSWLASRDSVVELRATLAAHKQVLEQTEARQRERDVVLTKALAAIEAAKRAVQTPAQAAAQIPQILPLFSEPIRIEIPAPEPTDPIPPAVASVPQASLKPLYDYLQDCRGCQMQLTAAKDDFTDERTKVSLLTIQRDTAVRAARGGGFWSRVKRNAKWFVIGGALGAVAVAAAAQR